MQSRRAIGGGAERTVPVVYLAVATFVRGPGTGEN